MKKRLFSILLAVVMIATAINLAPVMEVWATIITPAIEKIPTQGHWDSPLTYDEDEEYTNSVAKVSSQGTVAGVQTYTSSDPDFNTRHVTMFNDCSSNSDGKLAEMEYAGTKLTHRGGGFTSEDPNNQLADDALAPVTISAAGCSYYNSSDMAGYGHSQDAAFFRANTDTDCRMIFRNYNNSDYTRYCGNGRNYTPAGKGTGIDFSEYDYFEFDIWFDAALNFKRGNNADGSDFTFVVIPFYETNDGNLKKVGTTGALPTNYSDANSNGIEGWSDQAFNFSGQMASYFDKNNDYAFTKPGEWITIRCDISKMKAYTTAPTVKQVTIHIKSRMSTSSGWIRVDNLRLVKNDTHFPYITPQVTVGGVSYDNEVHPSGSYFMINDFEFTGDPTQAASAGQAGLQTTLYGDGMADNFEKVLRYQEVWADDTMQRPNKNSTISWAHARLDNKSGSTVTVNRQQTSTGLFCGGEGVVTQGNYSTCVMVRNLNVYENKTASWKLPFYYLRYYDSPMKLKQYTHFAIDIFLRYPIEQMNSNCSGVTFAVDLYDKDTVVNFDNDHFNYNSGYAVKFFLPYGEDPWNSSKVDTPEYGQVVPLSTYVAPTAGKTAGGGMRLIFTREELVSAFTTVHNATHNDVLDEIDAMRVLWLNRPYTNENPSYEYQSYEASSSARVNYDICFDNFIAYTPNTSITIENKVADDTYSDTDQSFVYNLYGGYVSSENGYITQQEMGEQDYEGSQRIPNPAQPQIDDPFTKGYQVTVSVPANGRVTVQNLPFNSYYVSQQNWAWRYGVTNITCNDPLANDSKKRLLKSYVSGSNTAAILPRIGLTGTEYTNVSILDVMKQRNFTVTFENTAQTTQWLDGTHTKVNTFN